MLEASDSSATVIPAPDWDIRAEVLDQQESLATVKVVSAYLVDVCQLARIDGRWQIVNVLWTTRGNPPWFGKR